MAFAVLTATIASEAQALDVELGIPVGSNREAWYGDLHLHTSYSFDAYLEFGAQVDPDSAYRFARGEPGKYLDGEVKRSTPPLDFMAVTDHAEWIGVINTLQDANSALSRSEIGMQIRERPSEGRQKAGGWPVKVEPPPGVDTIAIARSAWQRTINAANHHYKPGKFTTFIAYEWTSMPGGSHLHRNVIFRGDRAPHPFTAIDSQRPEDLWSFLEKIRAQGYEALAIPHNPNLSKGLMFDWVDSEGRPIDQAYAARRASNEPLVEISQNKGQSETHPALSPTDEFSNFETMDMLGMQVNNANGGYVRDALGRGLQIAQRAGGVNPFKYGFVGASDFHNGLSDSAENAYAGQLGAIDSTKELPDLDQWLERLGRTAEQRAQMIKDSNWSDWTGSPGLTGVWAEQNTRESIYAALRRKETFATSGTRLKFHFFGGWDFHESLFNHKDWVKAAYHTGVPMGGDLPREPAPNKVPKFAMWAMKDPNGANLDRLQVVKVWLEGGKHVEKVYDVALSNGRSLDPGTGKAPPVGNTVDLQRAAYSNTLGTTELSAVWKDPQFDPKVPTIYYLRVLEIPTPRWSTIEAVKRRQPLPEGVPATVQERGWSSPIWYTP